MKRFCVCREFDWLITQKKSLKSLLQERTGRSDRNSFEELPDAGEDILNLLEGGDSDASLRGSGGAADDDAAVTTPATEEESPAEPQPGPEAEAEPEPEEQPATEEQPPTEPDAEPEPEPEPVPS